jgi:AraC-like DNA-binding protein
MLQTVIRSSDLLPEERLTRCDEATGTHPVAGDHREPESVRFALRAAGLGSVRVAELKYANTQSRGGKYTVTTDGPGLVGVFLLSGELPVAQEGRLAELSGSEFTIYDSSQPAEIRFRDGKDSTVNEFDHIRVWVPHGLVPLPRSGYRRLAGARLPGHNGMGRLLTQFITTLAADDTATYTASDKTRAGTIATDLFTAALAHHVDATVPLPDASRRAASRQVVQAYIQRRLGDPDLSPGNIAAAHHISLSYLHRLFEGSGSTVAAWVRQQRMERARRDLADPAMEGTPVQRIAARWGYTDHATFTRAFRAAYGMPPQAYRATTLNGTTAGS